MKSIKDDNIQSYPIYECLINASWKDMGHARVLVSRIMPDKKILFASFLVDLYCLGVKDVVGEMIVPKTAFEAMKFMMYFDGKPVPCNLNLAHTLIYRGIKYARGLGFEPHPDFEENKHILIPEHKIQFDPSVGFGKDGKPLYVQRPEDDVKQVLKTLEKTVGKGNFDFVSQEDIGMDDDEAVDELFEEMLAEAEKKKK